MQSTDESSTKISASELQTRDPKRFEREYSKWTEYNLDYDWWGGSYDLFKEDMTTEGVDVDNLYFSISYSQGDYASFEGTIDVSEWMQRNKDGDQTYAEKYPALFLAICDYGGCASVSSGGRDSWPSVNWDGACVGNTPPAGIFAMLEPEAWDELVADQYAGAGIEDVLQEWVKGKCRELYDQLLEEYEYLNSEESFIESCEYNDVTFEIEEEDHEICN